MMGRTKDRPEVVAAWQRVVECARDFVRCANEFDGDMDVTSESYGALEAAMVCFDRAWDSASATPEGPRAGAILVADADGELRPLRQDGGA